MTRKRTFLRKTKKVTSPKKSVNSSERYLLQFFIVSFWLLILFCSVVFVCMYQYSEN